MVVQGFNFSFGEESVERQVVQQLVQFNVLSFSLESQVKNEKDIRSRVLCFNIWG